MTETFDVIVIGGGPAGEVAAQYAIRDSELTVALVEEALLGGECSYYACMPSKALLRPLDVAAASEHLGGLTPARLDTAGLLARRDDWVSHYSDKGQVTWAEGLGITVIRGRGVLDGDRRVRVGDRELTARQAVVVATGSAPVIPDIFQDLLPWTSRDATGVAEVPDRLVIIGGGVVACEAARWLAALGTEVTLLARHGLLGKLEPFCGEQVATALTELGVVVRTDTEASAAKRDDARDTGLGRLHGGSVHLTVNDDQLVFDEILIATGRRPALEDVSPDPTPDWLHYVGDASGEAPLTHWGKYRARLIGTRVRALALGEAMPASPLDVPVPQVVFTWPQVASVGLTLKQARERWPEARALDAPMSGVAGAALLRDDVVGSARLVVSPDRVLRGATFTGPEVAELLHSATVAIVGGLTLDRLWHAVPSYPTASEIWLRLLETDLD